MHWGSQYLMWRGKRGESERGRGDIMKNEILQIYVFNINFLVFIQGLEEEKTIKVRMSYQFF